MYLSAISDEQVKHDMGTDAPIYQPFHESYVRDAYGFISDSQI